MRLRVEHETRYCYDAPVAYGLQQTRLRPKDVRGQKVLDWEVTIEGGEIELHYEDHNRNMVDLIGIDHVGLSSDFDGGGGIVDWFDAGETFNVTLELVRRGYSRDDIEKLWGGNLLRVWREVEEVAAESG